MKSDILKIAATEINKLEGIDCQILNEEMKVNGNFIDAKVAIHYGDEREKYFVEEKKKIVPSQVSTIIEHAKNIKPLIVIADYITPKAKELLRMNGISYADTAGNMFLKTNSVYILIQTNNTNRDKIKTNTRAFNPAGLKVIYQFLTNPEYINKPYRFIGNKANVTIATVGVVLKDLLREKYIIRKNDKEYEFQNREKLFQEWVKGYNRKLKPKLRQKRYKWLNKKQNWRKVKLPKQTFWGGANAAEKLTEYLIAENIEIYTGLNFAEVMKSLKLLPDASGEIIITEIFWKDQVQKEIYVNPMLIYADLVNEGNARYLETADLIYQKYVKNKL